MARVIIEGLDLVSVPEIYRACTVPDFVGSVERISLDKFIFLVKEVNLQERSVVLQVDDNIRFKVVFDKVMKMLRIRGFLCRDKRKKK